MLTRPIQMLVNLVTGCGCALVAAFIVWMLVNLVTGCGNVDGVCILHPTIPTPDVMQ